MRLGVLGLGSAGRRHASNLLGLGHEVVGWDPAAASSPFHPEMETAPSAADAIDRVEAVIIASPNSEHAGQAADVVAAGKHVLIEKPIATELGDATNVAASVERGGVVGGVAMNLRFHPAIRTLKKLIDGGELGRVLGASAWFGYDLRQWRPGDYRRSYSARADLGGGIVFDAIHELDYLLWLLGPVESVSADTGKVSDLEIDVEDSAVACLRFRSDALATLHLDFVQPAYRRGCMIAGTLATAHWDWNAGKIELRGESRVEVVEVDGDVADTYHDELVDFVDAIGSGRDPQTPLADGVEALRLAISIKHAAREGVRVRVDSLN